MKAAKIWWENIGLSLFALIAMRKNPPVSPNSRALFAWIMGFKIYLNLEYLRKEMPFGKDWKNI